MQVKSGCFTDLEIEQSWREQNSTFPLKSYQDAGNIIAYIQNSWTYKLRSDGRRHGAAFWCRRVGILWIRRQLQFDVVVLVELGQGSSFGLLQGVEQLLDLGGDAPTGNSAHLCKRSHAVKCMLMW